MAQAGRADVAEAVRADPRWAAVLRRDTSEPGAFVYAVRTTGIFCRPGCPSRLANPEHVSFFDDAAAATAAGFRSCRRCRPDDTVRAGRHAAAVSEACRRIEAAESSPTLELLARAAGLSAFHFQRVFKATTGVTPRDYFDSIRANRMHRSLGTAGTITSAIYDAGFNASSRFYEQTAARLGMTPTAFRKGGDGTVIRFATGPTQLGSILVASSERGLCAITLGDDPERLVRDLQDRFPNAQLVGDDAGYAAVVAQVVGFVEKPSLGLELPLDIQGTAFQQRVWQALQTIPLGTTRTYTEIARTIGAPAAVRAVAGACAANVLAVAIPCHRVVRLDGDLSGYRWGVDRKRALLALEGVEAR